MMTYESWWSSSKLRSLQFVFIAIQLRSCSVREHTSPKPLRLPSRLKVKIDPTERTVQTLSFHRTIRWIKQLRGFEAIDWRLSPRSSLPNWVMQLGSFDWITQMVTAFWNRGTATFVASRRTPASPFIQPRSPTKWYFGCIEKPDSRRPVEGANASTWRLQAMDRRVWINGF